MKNQKKNIPVYSIEQFHRHQDKTIQYQVEIFNKNRDFKVTYPHRHDDFYEILFITHGSGLYTIDNQKYEITTDSLFFLSPGQIHEIEVSEDINGFIFLFTSSFYHFNKTNAHKIFELPFFYSLHKENHPYLHIANPTKNKLLDLFEQSIYEQNHLETDKEEALRALLDLILIHCKREYPFSDENKPIKSKILVRRFKQLIEEKCFENISVTEYALLLHVTPNHLSETVKLITGRTSTELINDRMLMEIKLLLKETDLSISEIAFKLNFSDQSYFSKYFKKLTNSTPQAYREHLKN